MRALPGILRRRPRAQVLLVGGSEVSYGRGLRMASRGWISLLPRRAPACLLQTGRGCIFWARCPCPLCGLLQLSTVHVYLTYPFVLSWSLLKP